MYLRLYRRDDIPSCSSIFCDAFQQEEFFAFITPYRREYPLAWRRFATQGQITRFSQPGMWGVVCVSDGLDGKGAKDEILGYAWWRRKVPVETSRTDKYMLNNRSISSTTERSLRAIEKVYEDWFCPNQCKARPTDEILARLAKNSVLKPLDRATHWHLSALAVASRHQRKGVGKMLVKWGLQLAADESMAAPEMPPIPVTLNASGSGRGLYSQLGFKIVGWKPNLMDEWARAMTDLHKHRKELHEVYNRVIGEERTTGGGCSMVFEPKEYWIVEVNAETYVNGEVVEAVWSPNALQGL